MLNYLNEYLKKCAGFFLVERKGTADKSTSKRTKGSIGLASDRKGWRLPFCRAARYVQDIACFSTLNFSAAKKSWTSDFDFELNIASMLKSAFDAGWI